MTHDELLANIDYAIEEYDKYSRPYFYALRAVVKLARPVETYGTLTLTGYNKAMSKVIQAIEEELK